MTAQPQENQVQTSQPTDKELNFRAIEQKLHQERAARIDAENRAQLAERQAQEALARKAGDDDDDGSDSEPYVDHKKLQKKLNKFGEQTRQNTQTEVQKAVSMALQEERRHNWLRSNPDFQEVMSHAQKIQDKDPELAETILEMPESFERQKLVYKSIKAMGLHRPEVKTPPIQEKIDANRRGPYYQPSGVGSAPYANGGDFSSGGQKQAYEKMQDLKNRLRLG